MRVRNNLDALVKQGEFTKKHHAQQLGISRITFIRLCNEKANPSAVTMLRIARYFKRSTDDIFFIEEEQA